MASVASDSRTQRSLGALSATTMVRHDMSTALIAGVSMKPHGVSAPATSGIATK